MIRQHMVLASAAGLVSALLLTGCGSANDVSSTGPDSSAPVATAALDPAASAPAAPAATATLLTVREMKGTAGVVTDDKGMTLYRYDKDRPNPSKWTCAGQCTKTWKPVMVQDGVRAEGIEKSLLGTVHRDGKPQLTLGGWPLYRYVGDTDAGQMNGQGKDQQWYAVSPTGRKSTPSG
ncbi:hypothetical protein [Streptomyces sp. NPDC018036]|uniref:hypothetical protein n=1 Tax=Streptomyces sp. NPDC018036 TaxID=3365035 RepID=UPI0037B32E5B